MRATDPPFALVENRLGTQFDRFRRAALAPAEMQYSGALVFRRAGIGQVVSLVAPQCSLVGRKAPRVPIQVALETATCSAPSGDLGRSLEGNAGLPIALSWECGARKRK